VAVHRLALIAQQLGGGVQSFLVVHFARRKQNSLEDANPTHPQRCLKCRLRRRSGPYFFAAISSRKRFFVGDLP
jgi:hypothetical protein